VQDGYSICCNVLVTPGHMPEPADIISDPTDPSESELGRTSRFLGVFLVRRPNAKPKWRAKFRLDGKTVYIGEFEKESPPPRSPIPGSRRQATSDRRRAWDDRRPGISVRCRAGTSKSCGMFEGRLPKSAAALT
jgi:hypothetical protein